MKKDVLVHLLRNRQEELCSIAADELEALDSKYQELGRSYDTMSADLLKLIAENKMLREELRGKNHDI